MLKPPFYDEISQAILSVLPTSVQHTEANIKQSIKEVLVQTFSRLDFVTREEFDVQTKVLQRTREKLEGLEQKLEALSKK